MAAGAPLLALLAAAGAAFLLAVGLLVAVREGGFASPAARRRAAVSIPFLALAVGAFALLLG